MVKNIIFDFDGTLADSLPIILKIGNELSHKHGFPSLDEKDIDKYREFSMRELLKEFKIPLIKAPFIMMDVRNALKGPQMSEVKLFPGIKELIVTLHSMKYRLFILTSNSEENVNAILKNNDVKGFEGIHSEDSIFGKDKKIKSLMNESDLKLEETVYVGDEVRDLDACNKLDLRFIAVTWGYNSKERLLKSHTKDLIDTPLELIDLLK